MASMKVAWGVKVLKSVHKIFFQIHTFTPDLANLRTQNLMAQTIQYTSMCSKVVGLTPSSTMIAHNSPRPAIIVFQGLDVLEPIICINLFYNC